MSSKRDCFGGFYVNEVERRMPTTGKVSTCKEEEDTELYHALSNSNEENTVVKERRGL